MSGSRTETRVGHRLLREMPRIRRFGTAWLSRVIVGLPLAGVLACGNATGGGKADESGSASSSSNGTTGTDGATPSNATTASGVTGETGGTGGTSGETSSGESTNGASAGGAANATGTSAGGGGGATSGDVSTPQDLALAYAPLFCQKIFECCSDADRALVSENFPDIYLSHDLDWCIEVRSRPTQADDFSEREAIGTLRFDPVLSQGCLEQVTTLSCADFIHFECYGVVGLVEPGGECEIDQECAEGVCLDSGPGTCGSPLGPGEECQAFDDCENGRCLGYECIPYLAIGEPCGNDADCATGYCDFSENPGEPVCADNPSTCPELHPANAEP